MKKTCLCNGFAILTKNDFSFSSLHSTFDRLSRNLFTCFSSNYWFVTLFPVFHPSIESLRTVVSVGTFLDHHIYAHTKSTESDQRWNSSIEICAAPMKKKKIIQENTTTQQQKSMPSHYIAYRTAGRKITLIQFIPRDDRSAHSKYRLIKCKLNQ